MQTNTQWVRQIIENPSTRIFALAGLELLLALSFFFLIFAGFCYWTKKRKGVSIHRGYIRYSLLLALSAGASLSVVVRDFYQADGLEWLSSNWVLITVVAILDIILLYLVARYGIREIPWWFDPRIGDDS